MLSAVTRAKAGRSTGKDAVQAFWTISLYPWNKTKERLDLKYILERCGFTDFLPQPIVQVKDIEYHLEIHEIDPRFIREECKQEKKILESY